MSQTYPLICTRGVILFPDQEIVIDVGREPSLRAIENAQDNYEDKICLFSQIDIKTENPTLKDIYSVGSLCEIRHVRRFENFLRVKFKGISRVKMNQWINGSLSDMADVEMLHSIRQNEMEEVALVRMIAEAFERMASSDRFLSKDLVLELSKGIGADQLSDKAIQVFPISTERKQRYLETLGINDRLEMLLADMEKEKKMSEVEKKINDTVKERIDQGQKDYYLREKMHAIKEELGDISSQDQDVENIRRRLNDNPYPEAIKKKVLEELSRYDMIGGDNREAVSSFCRETPI